MTENHSPSVRLFFLLLPSTRHSWTAFSGGHHLLSPPEGSVEAVGIPPVVGEAAEEATHRAGVGDGRKEQTCAHCHGPPRGGGKDRTRRERGQDQPAGDQADLAIHRPVPLAGFQLQSRTPPGVYAPLQHPQVLDARPLEQLGCLLGADPALAKHRYLTTDTADNLARVGLKHLQRHIHRSRNVGAGKLPWRSYVEQRRLRTPLHECRQGLRVEQESGVGFMVQPSHNFPFKVHGMEVEGEGDSDFTGSRLPNYRYCKNHRMCRGKPHAVGAGNPKGCRGKITLKSPTTSFVSSCLSCRAPTAKGISGTSITNLNAAFEKVSRQGQMVQQCASYACYVGSRRAIGAGHILGSVGRLYSAAGTGAAVILWAALLAPFAVLLTRISPASLASALGTPGALGPLETSIAASGLSLAILVVVGTPFGWMLAREWLPAPRVWEVGVLVPLLMPPLVIGLLLVFLLGPQTPLGEFLGHLHLSGSNTFFALVVAECYEAGPYYVLGTQAAFRGIDHRLEQTAAMLGDSPARTARRVSLPLAAPGLAAALTTAWARAMGAFGAVIIIAYHPYGLPLQIWTTLSETGLASALPYAMVLVVVALPLPVIAYFWSARAANRH